MNVNVAVRASNADLTEGAGRRVTVPANNRVEVRFPIAAVKPGTARFQIVAASGTRADAAEISLPVYTPATTEAFATYGVIDNGSIAQPVKAPADAVKTFGGLEITTASTQLQELTDAVIYLVNYPYECTEQIASRRHRHCGAQGRAHRLRSEGSSLAGSNARFGQRRYQAPARSAKR